MNEVDVTIINRRVRPIHVENTGFGGSQFLNLSKVEARQLIASLKEALERMEG